MRACRLSPPDPPAVRRAVDDLPLGGMRWLQRGSSVHPGPLPGRGAAGGDHPARAPVNTAADGSIKAKRLPFRGSAAEAANTEIIYT